MSSASSNLSFNCNLMTINHWFANIFYTQKRFYLKVQVYSTLYIHAHTFIRYNLTIRIFQYQRNECPFRLYIIVTFKYFGIVKRAILLNCKIVRSRVITPTILHKFDTNSIISRFCKKGSTRSLINNSSL